MKATPQFFTDKQTEFLGFLKSKFSLFHESNVFFRDLHYGVMAFLQMNRLSNTYSGSEQLTWEVVRTYENSKVFIPVGERTWMLNYPAFRKPTMKVAPPSKPVAKPAVVPAAAVPKTAPQNVAATAEVGQKIG